MSAFPYTTTSPPPTAGPLPVIERANLNTPYAAGGGGGGGGGPNLVVSTIQSQIVGQEDVIFIGANGNIIFDQPAGANAIQFDGTSNGEIRNRGGVFKIGGYPGQPEIPVSISTLVVSTINGAAPGGGGVGPDPVFSTLTTQLDATIGGSVICGGITINGPGATTTTLAVNASNLLSVANGVNTASIAGCGQIANGPNPVSISSLSVSSINGAAPSGGGVDPAGISTGQVAAVGNALNLRVGSTEGITLDGISNILTLTAGTGTGKVQFSAYSTIIGFDLNVSSINGAAPGGGGGAGPDPIVSSLTFAPGGDLKMTGSIKIVDGTTMAINDGEIFTGLPASSLESGLGSSATNGILFASPGAGGTAFALAGSDALGGLLVATNATTGVRSTLTIVSDGVHISSLNVSSINGAAPGGGSAAQFSTLFSGTSTISCDGGATTILLPFSTISGNTYQIQTQMTITGNGGQVGTDNDDVIQEVAGQLFLSQSQGSFISTCAANNRNLQLGTCGVWKATQTNQTLAIDGTFSTAVILGRVALIDYGAI